MSDRLDYLRTVLRAERISLDEIHELQGLARCIEPGDTELLEAAGVPERTSEGYADMFLDWLNSYISVRVFADNNGLTESEARAVVDHGRTCHERRVSI